MTLASEKVAGGLEKAGVITERVSATTESSFFIGKLKQLRRSAVYARLHGCRWLLADKGYEAEALCHTVFVTVFSVQSLGYLHLLDVTWIKVIDRLICGSRFMGGQGYYSKVTAPCF